MPILLIVLLAILLFLLLLATLRVRFVLLYRETVVLKLGILCFSVTLFPKRTKRRDPKKYTPAKIRKRRRRATRKAEKKAKRAAKKAAKQAKKNNVTKGAHKADTLSLHEKIVLVRALTAALIRKTSKHLHLTAARLHIRVATGDAATTAILYGAVSASLSYLLAALDRTVNLKSKPHDISVFADYLREKSSADIKLVFSMRSIGALSLLFSVMLAFVKEKRTRRAAHRQSAKIDQREKNNDTI